MGSTASSTERVPQGTGHTDEIAEKLIPFYGIGSVTNHARIPPYPPVKALHPLGYWWRSRFSRLESEKCKLKVSVIFDFATSIKSGHESRNESKRSHI